MPAGVEPWQFIVGTLATVFLGWLGLLGARATSSASKASTDRAVDQTAQDSALKAWEGLLQPYRDEVTLVRTELATVKSEHAAQEKKAAVARAAEKREVADKMDRMSERIDVLTIEVKHWKSMAKAIAKWATVLRDEILRLQGTVPQIPDELLIAQLLDDEPTGKEST